MNPCSIRRDGATGDDTSRDGTRLEVLFDEFNRLPENVGANMCVGVGVERYRRGPESGKKSFRGFSA